MTLLVGDMVAVLSKLLECDDERRLTGKFRLAPWNYLTYIIVGVWYDCFVPKQKLCNEYNKVVRQ